MIRRVVLVLAVAGLLAAAATAPALAKGGIEIRSLTITGPGLDRPVALKGDRAAGSERMYLLGQSTGLFRALPLAELLGQAGGERPLAATRPDTHLGPAYELTWTLRDPGARRSYTLRQVAYPYPSRGGWMFTKPGQALDGGRRSAGGWAGTYYTATLRAALVQVGLPAVSPVPVRPWTPPPPAAARPEPSGGWVPPTAVAVSLLSCVGLLVLASRRRAAVARGRAAATH